MTPHAPHGGAPHTTLRATLCATLGMALCMALGAAPAAAQQLIPAESEIAFTSRQMGVPVDGRFRKWSATVAFDPKTPQAGKVGFAIDTGSVTLGSADSDAEVVKSDWFNVAKFPQAMFTSSAIKAVAKGRYEVQGQLTIKGQAQAVTVPVTITQTGSGAALKSVATGAFPIKRLAFKIGEGAWTDTSMVADEVQVKFKLTLTGVPPL